MPGAGPGVPVRGLDALTVAFAYTGTARELIARAKYRRRHAALPFLAAALGDAVGASGGTSAEVVTWAPTTAARRRARGFDHAEVLARGVAAGLGLPAVGVLRRVGGATQTGRGRADRLVAPHFAVAPAASVDGRAVLLVDDVVTTGATLSAAADALRSAGARRVEGAAVARRA